ncbi:MAG: hypothetical protein RIE73_22670 [Coleofasciculus sp. C1-SOL-03]
MSKAGYFELLRVLSAEIVVPIAVRDEIYAHGELLSGGQIMLI